jgi:hypothetical protein
MSGRFEAFLLGASFRAPGVNVPRLSNDVLSILNAAKTANSDWSILDDRALVKLAVLSIAFYREVDSIVRGEFRLDDRDERILEAVVEHLRKGVS